MLDRRLYRELGFAGFEEYVRERMDLAPRTARRLVRLARAELAAPRLASAFRALHGAGVHLRGVHEGRVVIQGRAPEALRYRLGVGWFRSGDRRTTLPCA